MVRTDDSRRLEMWCQVKEREEQKGRRLQPQLGLPGRGRYWMKSMQSCNHELLCPSIDPDVTRQPDVDMGLGEIDSSKFDKELTGNCKLDNNRLYVCANPGDDAEEARGWKQAAVCLAVGGIESSRSRRWRRPKSMEIARRNRCGVDVLP
ncbi:hypothetical protein GW17_00012476 [Ensete ventricosum]|nr:hypothetical protein GW17_00012476 [Ensete ventricosum]